MDLKLEYLAPYLPYELKCHAMGEFVPGTEYDENPTPIMFTVFGANLDCVEVLHGKTTHSIPYDDIFPILRPLSYLTQKIEINGEEFVPVDKLDEMYGQTLDMDETRRLLLPITLENYILVRQLFEWHFDVFNLIENKLAMKKEVKIKKVEVDETLDDNDVYALSDKIRNCRTSFSAEEKSYFCKFYYSFISLGKVYTDGVKEVEADSKAKLLKQISIFIHQDEIVKTELKKGYIIKLHGSGEEFEIDEVLEDNCVNMTTVEKTKRAGMKDGYRERFYDIKIVNYSITNL